MNTSQSILSDITTYMKYARHIPEKSRRETWEEIVDRNKSMHLNRFPQLKKEIEALNIKIQDLEKKIDELHRENKELKKLTNI